MSRPTEQAEAKLFSAQRNFEIALGRGEQFHISMMLIGLGQLAEGLRATNKGLRATYVKLEEVEALIKRQGGP